jgi:hypothetical protein
MPENLSQGSADTTAIQNRKRQHKQLRRLAWLLDESIPLPGGYRIGVDGILGLIPGVGDISTALLSSYVIYQARALGAPKSLLFRMGINVVLETIIGMVPLLGDLFDFYFKANLRNMALLDEFLQHPKITVRKSRIQAAGFVLLVTLLVGLVVSVPLLLLIALIRAT